ncbi:hypothetical protein CDV31_012501 [Fusarium ambrosium]|uniref:Uncharacterized protein n=1 Tax=Fusarium ambrosium TaxID=131363 RepID=A0A428T988_9HYPO|nr:hypothetical protein CDV31_012501 [Fusarium ambrosium]
MSTSYLVDRKLCEPLDEVVDSDVAGWGVITSFTAAIVFNVSAIIAGYLFLALDKDRYKPPDHRFLRILGMRRPNVPAVTDLSNIPGDHSTNEEISTQLSHSAEGPAHAQESWGTGTSPGSDNDTSIRRRWTHPPDIPSTVNNFIPEPAQTQETTRVETNLDSHHDDIAITAWVDALESLVLGMSDLQLFTGMALMIPTLLMTVGLHGLNESLSVYSFKVVTMLAYFSFIIHLCSLTVVRPKKPGFLWYFRAGVMTLFLFLLIICMFFSGSVTFRFNSNVSVKCALQNLHMVDPQRPGYTNISDEAIIFFNLIVLIAIIGLGYYRRLNALFSEPPQNPVCNIESKLWSSLGLEEFESSFLLEIIWILFYFVFGFANLCKFLIDEHADVGAIEPSFGQLVPILLLVHPILSALQALSGI